MGFFDFLGQVVNAIGDISENIEVNSDPNSFDGTQMTYEKKMYRFLYKDCDFAKVLQFINVVNNSYPNANYELNYAPSLNPNWLLFGSSASNSDVASVVRTLAQSNTFANLDDLLAYIPLIAVSGFIFDVIGKNEYLTMKFAYEYNTDLEKGLRISERLNNQNEWNRENLERQLQDLQRKYNGWLGYNCFYVDLLIDSLQMEQIQNNITNFAYKYSNWLDEIYSLFLKNVIQRHNANFLQNMGPTQEQIYNVRSSIQQQLISNIKNACSGMNAVYRDINTCKMQISQMRQLVNQLNSSNMGSHILTGVLTFLNPVLGIANGARTMYGTYQNEQQVDRMAMEIEHSSRSLIMNCSQQITTLYNAASSTADSFYMNISQKHLGNAIRNIVETLINNGFTPDNNINSYFC